TVDNLVHPSMVVAVMMRHDHDVNRADPLAPEDLSRPVARGAGIHEGRFPFGRANQDRVALADVEKVDDHRPGRLARRSREKLGEARRGRREKRGPEDDEYSQRPVSSHSLMSPPGSVAFRSFWTLRVTSISLRVAASSRSRVRVITSPAFAPAGSHDRGTLIASPSSATR